MKCFVETLLNHYGDDNSLEKFTLIVQLSDDLKFVSSVYRCLRYAVESNVKGLKLGFCCSYGKYPDSYYNLPQLVFYAKSMALLGLDSCKLESPRGNVYDEYGLEQVYIQGMNAHSVHIIGLHILPRISVAPCKNLKKLKLCQVFIMDEWLLRPNSSTSVP